MDPIYIFFPVLLNNQSHTIVYMSVKSINSPWPSDAIWRQRSGMSGSALVQVMACCLMAASHYLKQCWLTHNMVPWCSFKTHLTGSAQDIISWNGLNKYTCKIAFTSPTTSELIAMHMTPLCSTNVFNTLRPRQDGRHFPDDIFKCIFLNENV